MRHRQKNSIMKGVTAGVGKLRRYSVHLVKFKETVLIVSYGTACVWPVFWELFQTWAGYQKMVHESLQYLFWSRICLCTTFPTWTDVYCDWPTLAISHNWLHPALFNSSVPKLHPRRQSCDVTTQSNNRKFARLQSLRVIERPNSPVWTLRWALRWDDLPYIFPQPVKGQQCLFSGESCCLVAAVLLLRATLFDEASRGASLPSPALSRHAALSCDAAASAPPRHLLAFGLHLFRSRRIMATICKVLLSWLSFSVSSVRPTGGRLGTQSAETETAASDITADNPDGGRERRQGGIDRDGPGVSSNSLR